MMPVTAWYPREGRHFQGWHAVQAPKGSGLTECRQSTLRGIRLGSFYGRVVGHCGLGRPAQTFPNSLANRERVARSDGDSDFGRIKADSLPTLATGDDRSDVDPEPAFW
jgi:hypothetical protein